MRLRTIYALRVRCGGNHDRCQDIGDHVIGTIDLNVPGGTDLTSLAPIITITITLQLPTGTDLSSQTPTIITNASSLSPSSRLPRNFTTPVTYTVTAADGSTRIYTVTVTAP